MTLRDRLDILTQQEKLKEVAVINGVIGVVSALLCASAMDSGDYKTAIGFFLMTLFNAMIVFLIKK